jgi:hypothetical protein
MCSTQNLTQRHTSSRTRGKLLSLNQSNSELKNNKVFYKCFIGVLEVRCISVNVTHKDKMNEVYSDVFNYLECAYFEFEKYITASGMRISIEKLQVDWVIFNDNFRFKYAEIRKSNKKANLVESELKLKKTQPMWKAIA